MRAAGGGEGRAGSLSFWRAGDRYFLQTDDPATAGRIRRWIFARPFARGVNCCLHIFAIPSRRQLQARRLAGLPKKGDIFGRPVRPGSGGRFKEHFQSGHFRQTGPLSEEKTFGVSRQP